MKIIELFVLFILLPFVGYSQIPSYSWGGQIGGIDFDSGENLSTDIFGNVVVTGFYKNTVDFDFDPSVSNTLSSSGNISLFIVKYDPEGNLIWVNGINGNNPSNPSHYITASTSDSSGNIYLTGYFDGTIDLNPSPDSEELYTSKGSSDIFLIKLDINGSYVWGGTIGGAQDDRAISIKVDDEDNLYITGSFQGIVDFDITENIFNLDGSGSSAMFTIKIDKYSNFIWGKSISGGIILPSSITVDASYNVYVAGRMEGIIDFDSGPGTFILSSSGNTRAVFVLKINEIGDFVNAGVTSSLNSGSIPKGNSIKLDSNSNIYITGSFSGTVDFDFSNNVQNLVATGSSAFSDVFVLKLDNDLNFTWVGKMGGNVRDEALGMFLDANDNIYTTGYFEGTSDFDPGPDYLPIFGSNGKEVFISVLDSDMNFVDAEDIVGNSDDRGKDIILDNAGNIYILGSFVFDIRNVPDFDFDSNGGSDGFLFKFGNEPNNDPDNFPPTAMDDSFSVSQGGNETVNLVANDSDPDGILSPSSIVITRFPVDGILLDNGDGTITYTHTGNSVSDDIFQYTIEDNDGASSNVATVHIATTLGMDGTYIQDDIRIYPNPTNSVLYIETNVEVATIEVFNLLGVKVVKFKATNEIDIANLSSGVYLLTITDTMGRSLKKMIIKN